MKGEKLLQRLVALRSPMRPGKQGEEEGKQEGKKKEEKSPLKSGRGVQKKEEAGASIRRKISLNWRNIYEAFKHKFGRGSLVSVEEFGKVMGGFGIFVPGELMGRFAIGSQVKYREFLRWQLGGRGEEG